jgi:erythromycin esterase-like protein
MPIQLMSLRSLRVVSILFLLAALVGGSSAAQTPDPATLNRDTDPVIPDLCGKSVALLGESPVHGFGKTLDFKVALVRRLVQECHYNALFIESPAYDFIHIQGQLHAGQQVTDAMISVAIGGLWANKEVQSLVPFLTQKANAGTLILGGLDDQLGRGTWAQHEMSAELVQSLPPDEHARCLAVLQKHTLWQYTDEAPYSSADKAKIVGCLDEIEARIPQPQEHASLSADQDRTMIQSLKRNFARDFTENDFSKPSQAVKWMNDRDRSMQINFQWWLSHLPPHSKVIVWAATVHTAKDLSSAPTFEGRVPLGFYIRQEFKDQAFSLGFSAYSGSYITVRPPAHPLSPAPADSLEARSLVGIDAETVYLSRKQLHSLGDVPARPLGLNFTTTRWDNVLDGLIVFREERPPQIVPF